MRRPRRPHQPSGEELDATLLLRSNLPISESRRSETKDRMLREARRVRDRDRRQAPPAEAGSHDGDSAEVHMLRIEHESGTLLMGNVEQLDTSAVRQVADRVASIASRSTRERRS